MTWDNLKLSYLTPYATRLPSKSARLAVDIILWTLAPILAFILRYDGVAFEQPILAIVLTVLLLGSFKLAVTLHYHIHRSSWRKTSFRDLARLCRVLGLSAAGPMVLLFWLGPSLGVPRSIPVIDLLLSVLLLGGARAATRAWNESSLGRASDERGEHKNTLIVGAGEAGTMVARDMLRHPEKGLSPIGFLDDDPAKIGQSIAGVPVLGKTERLLSVLRTHGVDEVLIAMPSAGNAVVRHLKRALEKAPGIKYRVLPGVYQLLDGTLKLERLRDMEISDLLRRPPVSLDTQSIRGQIEGRTVMVTGAGGSIGSELVRQICQFRPSELILFGHGENSIYRLERELDHRWPDIPYRSAVGAVQNGVRLEQIFRRFRPHAVFHAAAHKHVPLMELNPEEAIFNNVLGSQNLVSLALRYDVKHFVNISTDKAVNPTSIMGASKRLVECLVQRASTHAQADQVFVSVRFGNVLGSRGSVIPLFEEQIRSGQAVTVTHPEMVRYFMTIPEAVQLVLQASARGRNGEIYILDMGAPVKIVDLAREMIRLAGLEPELDVPIRFTGVRPGEKLVEELLSDEERLQTTIHDEIFVASPLELDEAALDGCISRLTEAALRSDTHALRRELNAFVPGCALDVDSDPALLKTEPAMMLSASAVKN